MAMLTMRIIFVRLAVAALVGAAIGLERVFHRRPAGLRTSMFVCFGAALFTVLSGEVAREFGDTSGTRIVSNLIPGIGFLGAGAIIRERGGVTGLTTAATIFVLAAIGLALGAGLYMVGILSGALALFGLVVLAWLEDTLHLRSRMVVFRVTTDSAEPVVKKVHEVLAQARVPSQRFQVTRSNDESLIEFDADVNRFQEKEIFTLLAALPVQFVATPLEGSRE
jgi:putative Mg2+ transporter-C (MgtC) family protein